MTTPRTSTLALVACAVLASTAAPATGQTVYTWNNTGADWSAAGSWSPAGPPPSGDYAEFNTLGTFGAAAVNNPTWASSPAAYGRLTLAPTAQLGGWTFASGGTLSQFQVRAFGPVTHTFSGPVLQDVGNGLNLEVGHGATLALGGTSTATTVNRGDLYGGTLRLDNSTTNIADRFNLIPDQFDPARFFSHGGTIDFIGHADGSTESIRVTIATGTSRINVEHTSTTAPTVLTLAALGRQLYGAVNFTNTGPAGTLGAAGSNPRVMISGQSAGFIRPWATAGSEFAFYNTTNGVRAAVSGPGGDYAQTYTTAIGTNLAPGEYGALDHDAGTPNITWTGAAGAGTGSYLRIRPGADNQSLTFALAAGNNINLGAIVLAGSRDYTITRNTSNGNTGMSLTGTGGIDHRNITVLDRNATLTLNIPIAFAAGGDVVKYGDGILDLTADMSGAGFIGGTASQTNLYVSGGVLRVNVGPNGSLPAASGQSVRFRGGVLEIAGGDLNGTAADFTRPIGTGAGTVNWNVTGERGSGGFSAFGSDATVNIGGAGAALNWNSTIGFVFEGQALLFGSVRSNATLTWVNPISLGGGLGDPHALREIRVTRGAGNLADFTRITGVITGGPNTDFVKTGNGVLELVAVNTLQGNVLVHGGTLVVAGGGSLGDPNSGRPGNVAVGRGAVLAGAGSIHLEFGKSVFVNPGGAIRGGSPVTALVSEHTGTLTVNTHVTLFSTATDNGTIQVEAHKTGPGTAAASRIVLSDFRNLSLEPGAGNRFTIELVKTAAVAALDAGQLYTLTLASVGANGNIRLNGSNLPDGVIAQSNYVLQSSAYTFDANYSLAVVTDGTGKHLRLTFTPVPEPATVLGVAVAGLGLAGFVRRKRRGRK